jgi:hypothetical protein
LWNWPCGHQPRPPESKDSRSASNAPRQQTQRRTGFLRGQSFVEEWPIGEAELSLHLFVAARKWPSTVSRSRCRGSMLISGPMASSGTNARSSSTSCAPLGVWSGRRRPGRLGATARQDAGRPPAPRSGTLGAAASLARRSRTTSAGSPGLRSRCSRPRSLPDRPPRRPVQHAPRPIASVVHGRPPVAVPLAAQATGSIVRSLKARVARIRTADLAAV